MTFIDRHFDKLLLTFLVVIFAMIGGASIYFGSERGFQWSKDNEMMLTAAIIALMRGSKADKGNPPQ